MAPSIWVGKLRPGESWCFMQGHAEGLEARSPALLWVPRGAPCPSIPPGVLQPGGAARTQTGEVQLAAPSCLTLDDGRAGDGGGGGGGGGVWLRLRAPRRLPSPGAQSHRLHPPQPCGRGWWAGQGPGTSPARAPRGGHPLPFHSLRQSSWSPEAGLRECTRAQNRRAHRPSHAAVIGAGFLRLGTVRPVFTSRCSLSAWQGTRDSTSQGLRFPLGGMETVTVSASESCLRIR